ncbi:MAG TPA: ABC transporter ATP-binding protein [Chloroflexi bacterium]|nr:ABC transporter ATP-binding protein [Chloroflexota bacterium]
MIETHDLSKTFGDFLAVNGVTIHVKAGEVLALLGPNGAGKTTTIRMLTAILHPTRGWAKVAGYDVLLQPDKVRARVGVLTEQHGLYGRMPADEYLDFYGELYNLEPAFRRKRIAGLLEQFGLGGAAHKRIAEFSKGMRQKLALARTLLHEPPVLLLDEPTSAMDPESARLVRDAIHQLRSEERSIIVCTHNLSEAEELADQIAIIRRGEIIALGTAQTLKQQLLGPPEFELRLGKALNGHLPTLPASVEITARGDTWLRYRTSRPEKDNPALLWQLLSHKMPVFSLQETGGTLEEVYLRAVNAPEEAPHAG